MRRKNYLILAITILTVVLFLTEFICAAEKQAEEIKVISKVITISSEQGVAPTTLASKQGTTVIWVNYSRSPAEILFRDKKVVLACGSPVNFFVGKDGAYESGKIPFGGTASLCFIEKGKYEYTVTSSRTFYPLGEDKKHRGVIWIK
jgi:plastocyanin